MCCPVSMSALSVSEQFTQDLTRCIKEGLVACRYANSTVDLDELRLLTDSQLARDDVRHSAIGLESDAHRLESIRKTRTEIRYHSEITFEVPKTRGWACDSSFM
jgi:hypothetical protein